MPAGRPTSYDPIYAALVITHVGAGRTIASFAAEIGVSTRQVRRWKAQHPDFAASLEAALTIAPPAVEIRTTTIVFSLSAWGVRPRPMIADGVQPRRFTEDEVDDMLARAA